MTIATTSNGKAERLHIPAPISVTEKHEFPFLERFIGLLLVSLRLAQYNPLIPAKAGTQTDRAPRLSFFTYILASDRNGTLYVGHTDDIARRVWLHREKALGGFTAKYGVDRLVWYVVHDSREEAFAHERRIKKWNRAWKLRMIEAVNSDWNDLYESLN